MTINFLIKALCEQDNVFVGGLGQFTKQHQSARICDDKILPPSNIVTFDPDYKGDDFHFTLFMAQKGDMLFSNASSEIEKWVNELKNALDNNKSISFEGFGSFAKDENGAICFESEIIPALNVEYEGMEQCVINENENENENQESRSDDTSVGRCVSAGETQSDDTSVDRCVSAGETQSDDTSVGRCVSAGEMRSNDERAENPTETAQGQVCSEAENRIPGDDENVNGNENENNNDNGNEKSEHHHHHHHSHGHKHKHKKHLSGKQVGIILMIIVILLALAACALYLFRYDVKELINKYKTKIPEVATEAVIVDTSDTTDTQDINSADTTALISEDSSTVSEETKTKTETESDSKESTNNNSSKNNIGQYNTKYIDYEYGKHYVIAGSFPNEKDAERHIRDKHLDRFNPKILKQAGVPNLRVCIGVFDSEAEAENFGKNSRQNYWILN